MCVCVCVCVCACASASASASVCVGWAGEADGYMGCSAYTSTDMCDTALFHVS